VKVALVFWSVSTHVELESLYFNFYRILLCRDKFELAYVVLSPYCRHLYEDCEDFNFGNARVRDKLCISISESIVLDNPRFLRK